MFMLFVFDVICICFLQTCRVVSVMKERKHDKVTLHVKEKILNQESSQRLSEDELITCHYRLQ